MLGIEQLKQLIHRLSAEEQQHIARSLAILDSALLSLFEGILHNHPIEAAAGDQLFLLSSKILQIIHIKHAENDVIENIHTYLLGVKHFFKQKNYTLCANLLEEAEALAIENDLLKERGDILEWKKTLVTFGLSDRFSYQQIVHEQQSLCEKMSNYWQYVALNLKSEVISSTSLSNVELTKRSRLLSNDFLLLDENNALSTSSKILYHNIISTIARNINDYEQVYKSHKAMLDIYGQNDFYINAHWYPYLNVLNNFANTSIRIKEYDEALVVSDLLKQMYRLYDFVDQNNLNTDLLVLAYLIDLRVYKHTADIEKSLLILPEVLVLIEEEEILKINNANYFNLLYEVAEIYFWKEKYDKSLLYLDKIVQLKRDHTQDMMAQLLRTLVYMAENRAEEAQKMAIDIRQIILLHRTQSHYATLFANFVGRFYNVKTQHEKIDICRDYLLFFETTAAYKADAYYVDMLRWLKQQIAVLESQGA